MVIDMTLQHKLTIQLIRYEIAQIPVDQALLDSVTDDVLSLVYQFSVEQDVAYIVGCALNKLGLLSGDIKAAFFNEQLASVYRCEQLMHELQCVCSLFEAEQIPFVALKGSVIRKFYPKPEMRVSCDTDILIHKENLEKASELLKNTLGYEYDDKCGHDISFYSPSQSKLELHHTLLEYDFKGKEVLDKVWEHTYLADGFNYNYEFDKEFFMFYHFVHMAKHMQTGGCGLRLFLDTYILKNELGYDASKLSDMLSKSQLSKFAEGIFKTAEVWFGTDAEDDFTLLMADYVFDSGLYGSVKNHVALSQAKNGSRFKTLVKRIFMSYSSLKIIYPIIEKYPILTPVFEVVRWFRIIFKDKAKKQMAVIKHNASISEEKRNQVATLLKNLELM